MREYQREEYRRYFREFLGCTNIVGNYAIACAEAGRSMRDTLAKHEPKNWILCAFIPHQTREGYEFWAGISEEWNQWVEDIENTSRM